MDRTEPTAQRARSIRGSGPHAEVTVGSTDEPARTHGAGGLQPEPAALAESEAIRAAILELFADRTDVTLDAVADRAGVAIRTIFRRFGDLEGAITEALDAHLVDVFAFWEAQRAPDPALPLDERIEIMLDQRFELEKMGRPMRYTRQNPNPDIAFDAQVLEAFAPELERFDHERRQRVSAIIGWALRPRSIRIHLDSVLDEAVVRTTTRATLVEVLSD